jgi:hypothetical protein
MGIMTTQTEIQYPDLNRTRKIDIRWFSERGCVEFSEGVRSVYVSGTLITKFEDDERYVRNVILLGLDQDKTIKKGRLARAFGMTYESLRRMRKLAEEGGVEALPVRGPGGSEPKINLETREKIFRLFSEGVTAKEAYRKAGKKAGVTYQTIWRMRKAWEAGQRLSELQERKDEEIDKQNELTFDDSARNSDTEADREKQNGDSKKEDGLPRSSKTAGTNAEAIRSGKMIQFAGALVLVAAVHRLGLYEAAIFGWKTTNRWLERLRVAMDALVIALGIGQKCVEGVRRLETKTAGLLLRADRLPSESWVRRIIKRYLDEEGSAKVHVGMLDLYLEESRAANDRAVVFYVDNHMRPYTGKHTLLKGWRMQDKKVKPGATDYYVHDEDGRPVFRADVVSHDSLTKWLSPVTGMLQEGLGKEQRVLVAFDRAGSYPNQMAELRENDFEFVTYERKPYRKLPSSAFTKKVELDGYEIGVHEKRLANLKKGRGRVRRIALRMPDKRQVNLLAVSQESTERLIEIITGRWVQENGFKHGKERWGLNQLDSRKVLHYAPDTLIPNPGRRRLEHTLKLLRAQEGSIRRKLARMEGGHHGVGKLKEELTVVLERQDELEELRPNLPRKAELQETEISGELVHHDTHYKTFVDTVRIACANVESDLASELAPYLNKGAEAKKALQNLFSSSGDIRVNAKSITIAIDPIGRKDEIEAFAELFKVVNQWKLTLPGDPEKRYLRFDTQK